LVSVLIWILIAVCFVLGFVGLVVPVLPSVVMVWVGAGLYHWLISSDSLTWWTWSSFIVLTILIVLADHLANTYFVRKFGGTRLGAAAAAIGVMIGCFVIPPLGLIIVPFLLVTAVELLQGKTFNNALEVGLGTVLAFLGSSLSKAVMQLIMVVIFIIDVVV